MSGKPYSIYPRKRKKGKQVSERQCLEKDKILNTRILTCLGDYMRIPVKPAT